MFFSPADEHYDDEEKQCYYNLNNVNFCENVLTINITKQECCCTLGAAWGDTCEMFPCPVLSSGMYIKCILIASMHVIFISHPHKVV